MADVTARGRREARQVIAEHSDVVLSPEAFDAFYAELDRPAEVVPELLELFNRPRHVPSP